MGADNREHSPVVIHALLGSLERFVGILIEHYGGEFPFWLAPVQVRVLPVGESHRDAAGTLSARAVAEGSAPTWTSATRRSASGSAMPSSRRCRSSSSTAIASPRTRSPCASGGGQSTRSLDELLETFRALAAEADPQGSDLSGLTRPRWHQACYASALQAGAHSFLT